MKIQRFRAPRRRCFIFRKNLIAPDGRCKFRWSRESQYLYLRRLSSRSYSAITMTSNPTRGFLSRRVSVFTPSVGFVNVGQRRPSYVKGGRAGGGRAQSRRLQSSCDHGGGRGAQQSARAEREGEREGETLERERERR
ncbi:hypothetical protein EYF80_049974 [Liparis tanakae]|uniref:Uncharacterized protein n=1 Tax=Liparis tanakae TaxID=230148 RepID=A0A4Z2FG43_9TELE|nr:hypothetical protein EYF80_049974 [Liparis tanakae]